MTTPYVYLIGWGKHNKFYYGRRTGRNCSPSDLWSTYFTSSIHVAQFRANHGEPDIIQVRKTFTSIDACRAWEEKVLRRLNAAKNERFLNRRNGDNSNLFNTHGTAIAKCAVTHKKLGPVSIEDPRWKTGEIVGITKGMLRSVDTKAKLSAIRKGTNVGLIVATGKYQRMPVDDPRWITGEVVHPCTGRKGVQSQDHINKRVDARRNNPLATYSAELKSQWSATRKGKKVAYDQAGTSLGLIPITDIRWGVSIFPQRP